MDIPAFKGAVCNSIGVELFFSDDNGEYTHLDAIRAVCKECPARFKCMEWALKHESEGIWAGTTPIQRKQMRREQGIVLEKIEPRWYANSVA